MIAAAILKMASQQYHANVYNPCIGAQDPSSINYDVFEIQNVHTHFNTTLLAIVYKHIYFHKCIVRIVQVVLTHVPFLPQYCANSI